MWIPDDVLQHVQEVTDLPDLSETKYRMVRPLGRGGMGVVYVAEDTELGREVAIKVSSSPLASPTIEERLRREARTIAGLEHPGIVPVHDVGVLPDGRAFYVMKLVRGERLDVWVKDRRGTSATLRLFQRVCEAVAFAHAQGVIHRDLKPENVMVGAFGEALVMDWGIARPAHDGAAGQPTEIAGTPGYMAPEQARGDAGVDARADVYALGTMLGSLFDAEPSAVPKPLASVRDKAMAREPADRYATALEVADEVGRFLDLLPVLAHREGPLERTLRFAGRHRVVLSLLTAYLLVRLLILLAR